jgi:hypothetical protein
MTERKYKMAKLCGSWARGVSQLAQCALAQSGHGLDQGREVRLSARLARSVDRLAGLGDGPIGPSP